MGTYICTVNNYDLLGCHSRIVHGWTRENVGQWIKQLNLSLYAHYYPLFSKHQITGEIIVIIMPRCACASKVYGSVCV